MKRRDFLRNAGLIGLGAGLTLAGCAPKEKNVTGGNDQADADQTPQITYPTKSIKHWVYQAAGGTMDLTTRQLAIYVSAILGQPVVVEQKEGASGRVARAELQRAKADGYLISTDALPASPMGQILQGGQYNVLDFTPIYGWANQEWVVTVGKNSPYSTFQELYEATQKNRLTVGTTGMGNACHLQALILENELEMQIGPVSFDGTSTQYMNLIGGHVDFILGTPPMALRNEEDTRALAVCAKERNPMLPDVPSLGELGFDVPATSVTFYCVAPPKLPKEIKDILEDAYRTAVNSDEYKEWATNAGSPPYPMNSEELLAYTEEGFRLTEKYKDFFKN